MLNRFETMDRTTVLGFFKKKADQPSQLQNSIITQTFPP